MIDFEQLWIGIPQPALALDRDNRIVTVNAAAELFFSLSDASVRGRSFTEFAPEGSRLATLIAKARQGALSLSEYGMEFDWPPGTSRMVDIQAAPIHESDGLVLLMILPRSMAEKMDRSLAHRGAARSLTGMAAALAHEIRNPLAAISGAAQLLEMNADDDEAELARLVHEEAQRIHRLIDRMELFTDARPLERQPVNIHHVLDQTRAAAEAGFGRDMRFVIEYDPSLPPTAGDRDQLAQAFLNLVKNAAEAAGSGGVITLSTAYRPGVRLTAPDGRTRESLPLEVRVTDNGPGIPETIARHMFEPFVTSKASGSGLGLALVSKIVADHGGVIDYEGGAGRTSFRLLLPVWAEKRGGAAR